MSIIRCSLQLERGADLLLPGEVNTCTSEESRLLERGT